MFSFDLIRIIKNKLFLIDAMSKKLTLLFTTIINFKIDSIFQFANGKQWKS